MSPAAILMPIEASKRHHRVKVRACGSRFEGIQRFETAEISFGGILPTLNVPAKVGDVRLKPAVIDRRRSSRGVAS